MARLDESAARRFLIALRSNNAELVASELKKCGLKRRGVSPLSNRNLRFLPMLLGIASAMSWQGWTFEEAKIEIIERVAGHVDTFKLARALTSYVGARIVYGYDSNVPEVPGWLRDAIVLNDYNREIATQIQQLDQGTMKSLLVFINENDNVKILDCRFSFAIAHAVHKNLLVPDDVLFMMFAGNLCAKPYRVE